MLFRVYSTYVFGEHFGHAVHAAGSNGVINREHWTGCWHLEVGIVNQRLNWLVFFVPGH